MLLRENWTKMSSMKCTGYCALLNAEYNVFSKVLSIRNTKKICVKKIYDFAINKTSKNMAAKVRRTTITWSINAKSFRTAAALFHSTSRLLFSVSSSTAWAIFLSSCSISLQYSFLPITFSTKLSLVSVKIQRDSTEFVHNKKQKIVAMLNKIQGLVAINSMLIQSCLQWVFSAFSRPFQVQQLAIYQSMNWNANSEQRKQHFKQHLRTDNQVAFIFSCSNFYI